MSIDVKQAYREVIEHQESVHIARAKANIATLRASTSPLIVEPSGAVRIHGMGYPTILFDPGQGRWISGNKTIMGNAEALIEWLKRKALK